MAAMPVAAVSAAMRLMTSSGLSLVLGGDAAMFCPSFCSASVGKLLSAPLLGFGMHSIYIAMLNSSKVTAGEIEKLIWKER